MGQPHESKGGFPAQPQGPRLLDRVRDAIRRKHYSWRTEETYIHWIKRFIYFHGKRHSEQIGERRRTHLFGNTEEKGVRPDFLYPAVELRFLLLILLVCLAIRL